MEKRIPWIVIVWILALLNPAYPSMFRSISREEIYLQEIGLFPLEFTISRAEEEEAWGRAQSFIARFSPTRLQIVTPYVIQTYEPMGCSDEYGYSVIKTPIDEKNVLISVECRSGNILKKPYADTNARILAYYIKTGKLPYTSLK